MQPHHTVPEAAMAVDLYKRVLIRSVRTLPTQNGFIQVIGAVGCCEHHHVVGLVGQHAVPQLHELGLERGGRLVLM